MQTNLDVLMAYEQELSAGYADLRRGDLVTAFGHFERAHILGQRRTRLHVRAHVAMLKAGWRRRDAKQIAGQITRIIAAALFSRVWVPEGNTGGANVNAMKRMPIPDDLKGLLEKNAK